MFQVRGLEPGLFEPLFALPDEALVAQGARRVIADADSGYPCRISLRSVGEGEEVLLVNYEHRPEAHSPYRAKGPIFVSRLERGYYRDEVPLLLRESLVSLKAYDADAFIVAAEVVEGREVRNQVERYLHRADVDHVDAHFARRGCFAARFERA
jgi:hypothetical protein